VSTDERLTSLEAAVKRALLAIEHLRIDVAAIDSRASRAFTIAHEAEKRVDNISNRLHAVEDHIEPGNAFDLLSQAVWSISNEFNGLKVEIEQLKRARAAGDDHA
jgi:hypothetical protein